MSTPDELKQAWRSQAPTSTPPSLEDVRRGADRLYEEVRRRNRIEYAACLVVSLLFAGVALFEPGPAHKTAGVLVVLGCAVVAWQLNRRASAAPPPAGAGQPLIDHQRAHLVRQREALSSVVVWYLLPLTPGLMLFGLAPTLDAGPPFQPNMWDLAYAAMVALVFAVVWRINHSASRRIQAEIQALDELQKRN